MSAMDAEDRKKMDSIAERLAENGGISRASAHRLLQQVFFQEDISDRFVRTEAGFVALGLTVFVPEKVIIPDQLPEFYRNLDRFPPDQPRPMPPTPENRELLEAASRRMEFHATPVLDRPNHYRWVVSVAEDEAPEILRIWDRYVRSEYAANLARMMDTDEEGRERSSSDIQRDRHRVALAEADAEREKQVWDRERRRHWPFRVVVDNTVRDAPDGEEQDMEGEHQE
ncbi:hypothetical protein [Acidithiobacillus ferriphilus]|uniref:hypothetical protein n=1 Tax=Acidithiobacillus ferriphilus TaxID=1689834 RepID=UPI002DBC4B5A|nr:hypothetical protein [Acidithiobacillus ferriphilus]MEB8536952.1 hypothetical protein [Acidithiobacillus ferriphilus]